MLTENIFEAIKNVMLEAGKIILSADGERESLAVSEKHGTSNFVTEYDVAVQKFIIEKLEAILPHAEFFAEEKANEDKATASEYCFIIDPIDGTANFINGVRHSCISVALLNYGEPLFGAVYNPYQSELFYAVRGKGAFLNGNPISVAERPIERAIVSLGTTPYDKGATAEKTLKLAYNFLMSANDLRRQGAAALDLAYVAAGRIDIFFELMLQPWDFAAGALILTEAGGVITDLNGAPIVHGKPSSILASGKTLHPTALRIAAE